MSRATKIVLGVGIVLFVVLLAIALYVRGLETQTPATTNVTALPSFGASGTVGSGTSVQTGDTNQMLGTTNQISSKQIFKLVDGPVAGAMFIQVTNPTTTIVRFVMQENGHVLDMPVDVPGASSRPISNTTIPGVARTIWTERGSGVILQYTTADGVVKTNALRFAKNVGTSSEIIAPSVTIFPDRIIDLAVSPDGSQVTYLLENNAAIQAYRSTTSNTSVRAFFSLPLLRALVSWPSPNTLLVQTPAASGVMGGLFFVQASSGAVTPLVFTPGITAIADQAFSRVIYQSSDRTAGNTTYIHSMKTGLDTRLSFTPYLEQCVWGTRNTATLFCAAPLAYMSPDYIDLRHQGAASAPATIVSYQLDAGKQTLRATPGSSQGGVPTDIHSIAVSPDEKYLLFVSKDDRSLWVARLTSDIATSTE